MESVVATGQVPISAPPLFTANDCLDIGRCLGGPVSLDYFDRAPFPFTGIIEKFRVAYTGLAPIAGCEVAMPRLNGPAPPPGRTTSTW